MKRCLLYIIVLALVLVLPVERTDVGKLRPVQAVVIYREGNDVRIGTDTGDVGSGTTALEALNDLKATTPAVIYLDTADFLIVSDDALDALEPLRGSLKDAVRLYSFVGTIDPSAAAQYLSVHGNGPRLEDWKPGMELPILDCREERINFL